MAAEQQHRPDGERRGRRHALVRVLREAGPGLSEVAVHPAGGERVAGDEIGAIAALAQQPRQAHAVVQRGADRAVTAGGGVGLAGDQDHLPAGGAERGPGRGPHHGDRQVAEHQEIDHRHGQALAQRPHHLARHAADEIGPALAGVRGERRRAVRRQGHVGIEEQQALAPRRAGERGAGVVLAGPSLGQGGHGDEAQARIGRGDARDDRGGVVGRVIVADQDLDRDAAARQRRPHGALDHRRLVAGGDQDRDEAVGRRGRRGSQDREVDRRQPRREQGQRQGDEGENEERQHHRDRISSASPLRCPGSKRRPVSAAASRRQPS